MGAPVSLRFPMIDREASTIEKRQNGSP
jgi:hypothetical protein